MPRATDPRSSPTNPVGRPLPFDLLYHVSTFDNYNNISTGLMSVRLDRLPAVDVDSEGYTPRTFCDYRPSLLTQMIMRRISTKRGTCMARIVGKK